MSTRAETPPPEENNRAWLKALGGELLQLYAYVGALDAGLEIANNPAKGAVITLASYGALATSRKLQQQAN